MTRLHPLHAAISLALVAGTSSLPALARSAETQSPDGATTADARQLDYVEVRPQFESQMRAIEVKRASDAIQDTVSSDSMGQYPDKNVGESLQRLPGISVTRDQGEGRYVVVRGLDAAQNSVTVDGIAIGTPEDSSRAAPLDTLPSDSTERLTVIKAPTPDLPGDSLGGTILVESASAFDRDGRHMRAKAELSHQVLSGNTSPKASFHFSDVYGGVFGVALGLSYQDRDYQSDNVEVEYDKGVDGLPEDEIVPIEIQQRKYYVNRERSGINLNLDYRPDKDNSWYLRTLFTDFTDAETRQNSIIPVGAGEFTALGDGRYQVDGIDPGDFSRRVRFRTKEEDLFATSFGGEHRFGASKVDYQLGYTKSRERVDDEVEARFQYRGAVDGLTLDTRSRVPTWQVDDTPDGGWLRNVNYRWNRFVLSPKQVDDEAYSAALNFRHDGETIGWKAGLSGRWRDRDVNVDEVVLRGGPQFFLDQWSSGSPAYRHGNMGDGISSGELVRYLQRTRGAYFERPQEIDENREVSLIEDYVASEDVLAGYLMATMDFGALRVIAGARVEKTSFEATGNAVEYDADGDLQISQRRADSDYTSVLPGLHLRYDTGNDWVLRGAYTHTIARPTFGDISPRTSINREDDEVDLGNPLLDPYKSRNIDLSFERYLGEGGIFSAGLFHKKLDGYIVETFTQNHPDYPGSDVTQPINGDDARVYGVELNWQQQLEFLPGAWSGLLVGASGTWLDTRFTASTEDRAGEVFTLPLSSERLYSAHVGYEKHGLSMRLSAVYRSEYLEEIGDEAAFDIYVAPNTQFDFTLDYAVNDDWGVFFEASNLLDEPLELYQGTRERTLQNELYGRTYVVGAKLRF